MCRFDSETLTPEQHNERHVEVFHSVQQQADRIQDLKEAGSESSDFDPTENHWSTKRSETLYEVLSEYSLPYPDGLSALFHVRQTVVSDGCVGNCCAPAHDVRHSFKRWNDKSNILD